MKYIVIILVCILVIALASWWSGCGGPPSVLSVDQAIALQTAADAAFNKPDYKLAKEELQKAKAAWAQLAESAEKGSPEQWLYRHNAAECQKKIELAEEAIKDGPPPPSPLPDDKKPEPVPAPQLLDHYPVGRQILSYGYFLVAGKGENTRWFLKTKVNFGSRHHVTARSKVIGNDGKTLVVEQEFLNVMQTLETATATLETDFPKVPVLQAIPDKLLLGLVPFAPKLVVAKKALDFYEQFDPNYKRLLTAIFKATGIDPEPTESKKFNDAVKDLSGVKLRFTYISGYGMDSVEQIGGQRKQTAEELVRLANRAGLLTDYYIGQVDALNPGQSRQFQPAEIGQMIALPYDSDISGTLTLKKTGNNSRLDVVSGNVEAAARVNGIKRHAKFNVKEGSASYSPADKLVTDAKLKWTTDLEFIDETDLLFGTRNFAELKFETYYEARPWPKQ